MRLEQGLSDGETSELTSPLSPDGPGNTTFHMEGQLNKQHNNSHQCK